MSESPSAPRSSIAQPETLFPANEEVLFRRIAEELRVVSHIGTRDDMRAACERWMHETRLAHARLLLSATSADVLSPLVRVNNALFRLHTSLQLLAGVCMRIPANDDLANVLQTDIFAVEYVLGEYLGHFSSIRAAVHRASWHVVTGADALG